MMMYIEVESFAVLVLTPGKSIKLHLYWAMRNCGGSPDALKSLIENVPEHYKVLFMVSTFLWNNNVQFVF